MPTKGMSLADVERTTRKGWCATLIRLLVVVLVAGLGTLVYGHTTAHGDGPAARVDPLQGAQQPTATPTIMLQQPAVVPPDVQSLAQEVELLKVRVEAELEASEKANERNFRLFTFVSGFVGLFGLVTLVSTWIKGRQEHEDYKSERKFYEERVLDHEFRHREENLRATAMFSLQEANLREVNTITTAIAEGASRNVESLNTILATFQRIMEFKVDEAGDTRQLVEQMKSQLAELEAAQRQQVEELLASAMRLRRPRHICASPDPYLRKQMAEFCTQMDGIQRLVLERYAGMASPAQNRRYGEIYLRRGIIAYYENDMVKAREMLDTAAKFFPVPALAQEIASMPPNDRPPTAFIQFYLALIEKNYGEMKKARDHIEKSYAVYGQNEPDELATPVTRAEILSYLGDMDKAREAIQEVLARADALRQIESLKPHDAAYALRAQLLLGNTYYVQGEWRKAFECYQKTLRGDVRRDNVYYAYISIAQVYRQLGKDEATPEDERQAYEEKARENQRLAYEELIATGHLRTKVALDTRIHLNALAYRCTRDDEPNKAREYREVIQDLWLQIHEVNGLELRLFSLEKRRLVDKGEFWAETFD